MTNEFDEEVDISFESQDQRDHVDKFEDESFVQEKEGNEELLQSSSVETQKLEIQGPEDETEVSDEQLDEIADTVISVLRDILKYFDVGEVTIDEYEGDEGELILDITGNHLEILIGRHGRTLEALHFLVTSITTRKIGYRYPVIIDVESYKSRQRQKLESLATSLANKAASQGRSVKMRPMTPYERRIIHVALRDDARVETGSEGEGTERHVVIVPVK